jgi:hypothetical protein
MAAFQNDSICREVCRAAASSDPKDCAKVAQSEIVKYNSREAFASYKLVGTPDTSKIELPASGHGLVSGSVKVKTAADVHAPFIIGFFMPDCRLETEQSFPYTYNIP